MRIPEQLFSLPLLKDLRTQQIELVTRSVQVTGVAGVIAAAEMYSIPSDRVGIVSTYGCVLNPVVIELMNLVMLTYQRDSTTFRPHSIHRNPFGPSTQLQALHADPEIWLPPGSTVNVVAQLVAGDIGNLFTFELTLLTLPRGNVSLS